MYKVFKSYDNQLTGPCLHEGTYEGCVAFIRSQKRLHGLWAFDIMYPSGRLASYVL